MRKRFSLVQAVLGLLIFVFVFVTPLVVHREGLSAQEKRILLRRRLPLSSPLPPPVKSWLKLMG